MPDLVRYSYRRGSFRQYRSLGHQGRADDGFAGRHGARKLDSSPVRGRKSISLCGQGFNSDIHWPRWRQHAFISILVGQFLGVRQVPITYETKGETRIVRIEKYVDGAITPIQGKEPGQNVTIR